MSSHRAPSKRSRQVGDLIHRELAMSLKRDTNDARLHKISITEVNASPDLRNARVFYTLLDEADLEDTKKALAKGVGFLRQCLAERVALRRVPNLEFVYDKNLQNAEKLASILYKIDVPDEDDK
jgi:ribosome-binding factor A